ncbi:MAG: hypothetical protein FJ304_02415 [Planctomycetes bacterium]|nr:hypothetical protein [Planctomycetota bacterium]
MFVPVGCTNCGKPFQVPDAALGQRAPCPWCNEVVTALPMSAPVSSAPAPTPAPNPAPAVQPKPAAQRQDALSLYDEPDPPPPPRSAALVAAARFPGWVTILIGCAVVAVCAGATLAYRHYGSGHLSEKRWVEFTAPDGSFCILLPGNPGAEDVPGNPAGSVGGGKRFTTTGWYSKTSAWVSYCDLEPAALPKLKADTDRVYSAGILQSERDREKKRLGVTDATEVMIRVDNAWGVELLMTTPRGKAVMWMVLVADGPRPRVYVFGAEGKDMDHKGLARRLFNTFRVNN